ncbi:YaaA family protein [Aquipuribacter hungaricus]|uniref:YaaA family protein n=1 Tax=Aquipuribacter hungaricus TaxID=545624 RepID=UPI00361E3FCA
MLLLLPPSEGKTPAPRGARPLDLHGLSRPGLTAAREQVLDALAAVSAGPDAMRVLGVGPSLAAEVARNTRLRTAPATDMSRVYSGVLFAALGLADLDATARRRARAHVVVVSALWGALSPGDRVPAYRLAMGTTLPGIGPLAAHWRGPLAAALGGGGQGGDGHGGEGQGGDGLGGAAGGGLGGPGGPGGGGGQGGHGGHGGHGVVVDCRSAPYAAAWRPAREHAETLVAVRVLSDGQVVSHHAKHTRGVLARHLLVRAPRVPRSPHALAEAAAELFDVELVRSGPGYRLDVHAPAVGGSPTA